MHQIAHQNWLPKPLVPIRFPLPRSIVLHTLSAPRRLTISPISLLTSNYQPTRTAAKLCNRSASYACEFSTFLIATSPLTTGRERYGTNKDEVPRKVANYFYGKKTGNTNLRNHLLKQHPTEYDEAVLDRQWPYKLSTQTGDASVQNSHNAANRQVPPFTSEAFLEHLVRFIVADDQVCPFPFCSFVLSQLSKSIRVIECPEFRQLCMILRESLVDADIPHRDKMREVIVNHWRKSFEDLKLELAVS